MLFYSFPLTNSTALSKSAEPLTLWPRTEVHLGNQMQIRRKEENQPPGASRMLPRRRTISRSAEARPPDPSLWQSEASSQPQASWEAWEPSLHLFPVIGSLCHPCIASWLAHDNKSDPGVFYLQQEHSRLQSVQRGYTATPSFRHI